MSAELPIWSRTRGLTDVQMAKFMSFVDGRGNIRSVDLTLSAVSRIIGCSTARLKELMRRLKNPNYSYQLQLWSNESYRLFYTAPFEGSTVTALMEISHIFCRLRARNENPSVSVKSKYVISNGRKLHHGLLKALLTSGIMNAIYETAKSFVENNRPDIEFHMFSSMFQNRLPSDCFVNSYPAGITSGVNKHRDHVSFCTVVLCLEGQCDGGLVLTTEMGQPHNAMLQSNEMIVFGRIDHLVNIALRTQERITLNCFF
jgi:hypothetical protein